MRDVNTGQTSGQRVKMKSATQTLPRRSSWVRGAPARSVRVNAGTTPRTGSVGDPHPAGSPARMTAAKVIAARARVSAPPPVPPPWRA